MNQNQKTTRKDKQGQPAGSAVNAGHSPEAPAPARDPLDAIPLRPDSVEVRSGDGGTCQLCRKLPEQPGIGGWISRKLKLQRDIYLQLDNYGAWFWNRIDDNHTLRQIASDMAGEFNWEADMARQSVLTFTRQLMERGFIALRIEPTPEEQALLEKGTTPAAIQSVKQPPADNPR